MTSHKERSTSTFKTAILTSSHDVASSAKTPSYSHNPEIIYQPITKTPLSIFSKEGQLALIHYLELIK